MSWHLRTNVYFSPLGRYAACIGYTIAGERFIERWSLETLAPAWHRVVLDGPMPVRFQLAPCDDGRILLLRNGDGRHEVQVLPADGVTAQTSLGFVAGPGARLIPAPHPGTLAYVAVTQADGDTALWRIDSARPGLAAAGTVPGTIGSTGWLGLDEHRLGITSIHNGLIRPAIITLSEQDQMYQPDPLPCIEGEPAHLLLASASCGNLLLACGRAGQVRLGWSTMDRSAEVTFPDALNRPGGVILPLAMSPTGDEIALAITSGASSRVTIWNAVSGDLRDVGLGMLGSVTGVGCWAGTVLRFPYSAPAFPSGLATVSVPTGGVRFDPAAAGANAWPPARTEVFDGPAGPIEAVVYGDWLGSDHVAVALHGGPQAAWRLGFEPLFQHLAAAGVAVVAPNQRGSTGYGAEYRQAIHGAWGGPDLDDTVCLGELLSARRGRPGLRLYGISYGAYLALLAAAHRPGLWDRCVAVAPFLSGARLYAEATDEVRRMIDRLGGNAEPARDLEQLCQRLDLPLLLVHGADDAVIPVSQSRQLLELLRRNRFDGGAGVTLIEVPGAGHDPFFGPAAPDLLVRVSDFLSGTRETCGATPVLMKEHP